MMNNSKIHQALLNSEIRDFISLSLVKNFQKECEIKKTLVPYNGIEPIERSMRDAEQEIIAWEKRLKSYRERYALIEIIKMNNWTEWDVSEYTVRDLVEYKLHMNFIGTEQEYNNLITFIELSTRSQV